MTALRPKNRNAGQADKPAVRRDRNAGDAEALRRRVEEPELENAVMREVAEVVRKRPGRRPAAPVEQGEDASGRPSEADVFAQLDDMLARHRTGRPPTATTPGSSLTDTPGCVSGWPGRSPLPRAGTGTAGQGHAPNPRRGARPDRRVHPLVRPRAHQAVARLDEPGTIQAKPGNGCVTISKKTSAAPYPDFAGVVRNVAIFHLNGLAAG